MAPGDSNDATGVCLLTSCQNNSHSVGPHRVTFCILLNSECSSPKITQFMVGTQLYVQRQRLWKLVTSHQLSFSTLSIPK